MSNYGAGQTNQERLGANAPREISALPKLLQATEVMDKEICALDEYVSRLESRLSVLCVSSPTTGAKHDAPPTQSSQLTGDIYIKAERIRAIRSRIGELLETLEL